MIDASSIINEGKYKESIEDTYSIKKELLLSDKTYEFNFGKDIELCKEKDKKLDNDILFLQTKKQELNKLFTDLSINLESNIHFNQTKDLLASIKNKESEKENLLNEVLIKYNTYLLTKTELNSLKKL